MIGSLSIPRVALFLSLAASSLAGPLLSLPVLQDCPCGQPSYVPPTHPTTPPTTCNNHGLAYAIQRHPFTNDGTVFDRLDVTFFHSATPEQSGLTKRVGFTNPDADVPMKVYDGATAIDTRQIGANHRGYFIPPLTGTYTFKTTTADDIALLWIGDNAVNGKYTQANADCVAAVAEPEKSCAGFLLQGEYYPIRALLVNGVGPTDFKLTVTGPLGDVMISDTSDVETPWFVQYSCDGKYPAFQDFGKET